MLKAYELLAALDPLTPQQREQCKLLLSLGGRGLRSQVGTAAAAWVGSWALTLAEVKARTDLHTLDNLEVSTLPLARHCRSAMETLGDATSPDFPSWEELSNRPMAKAQRAFSKRTNQKQNSSLLDSWNTEGKARLRSCCGPLASAWQQAAPGHATERLDDEEYELIARYLLGQTVAAADRRTCCNKRVTGAQAGDCCRTVLCPKAHHCFHCATGGGTKQRSAALVDLLEEIHKQCGFSTDKEVYVAAWDRWAWRCASPVCEAKGVAPSRRLGPCPACGGHVVTTREAAVLDLEVRSHDVHRLLFDVTVVHTVQANAVLLAQASGADGVVCRDAERRKHARYRPEQAPWRMVPVAFKSYGRLGSESYLYLKKLARKTSVLAGGDGVVAPSLLFAQWACRLSVCLHRCNVRMLRKGVGGVQATGGSLRAALAV